MVTSFTRIVVVLSLLRTAIGLQTAPPNSVMVSAGAVPDPIRDGSRRCRSSYDDGIAPLLAGDIQMAEAFELA
jgi:flagellar biosynthetic protein FliP